MDIPLNAKVSCSDGPCGKSTYLVLIPTNEEITNVVVRDSSFPETQYLVPIDRILESTPESMRLNCNHEELSKMPVFNQMEFIPSGLSGVYGSFSMLWPYATPEMEYIEIATSKSLPMSLPFGEESALKLQTAMWVARMDF